MCGAGLKMTINSFQDLIKTDKGEDNKETDGMDDLFYETANGALNGFISSLGLVCIAQNECNEDMNGAQQLITSYALTGLITGTINGTINEIIHSSHTHNTKQQMHGPNDDDIELMNVGKTGFMEMGSNLITAIGKSTVFKSANDDNRLRQREIRIHFPSYRHLTEHFYDFTKQKRDLFQCKVMEYGSIHKRRTQKVSNYQYS